MFPAATTGSLMFLCGSACALAAVRGDPASVRVACLGDSITAGARLPDRLRTCYPSVLGRLLGPGFEVRNFGVGGAALLRRSDRPYVRQQAFRDALGFRPDVALVMLGTNDTCAGARGNWAHRKEFKPDYRALIDRLRKVNSGVRILLCAPPSMRPNLKHLTPERKADLEARAPRLEALRRWTREVAVEAGVEFVDMRYTSWSEGRVVDGVHPTPAGAAAIAARAREAIQTRWDDAFQVRLPQAPAPRPFSFHGFRGVDFRLAGVACKLAFPPRTAAGAPWIWRARFWGHEPQADLALLERGFHVAYCDVVDLYGAPAAVRRWDRFYAFMRDRGFNAKPFLEGMSRGGLIVHNWAVANPGKVSGIYADNAVLDIKSWPGGLGRGQGSETGWEACLKAYGFADENAARAWRGNPLDNLATLARARIPILYLMGMADTVVPPAENGEIAVKRYRELGGPVSVFRKPDMKHHPHSLEDPTPIVEFVLEATGRSGARVKRGD
ncbi:MAG: hypothetical protein GXP31_16185 [Kiritimatiellaeota bacterium]|nr:hypothetical protein [Kiritimatiellota bacterium]